ncbi:MAG: UvrD-helicase domain-containing protein [Myxococcales bacterium]|nr:UvrD-helicase domain-containing protein [Myxococcales bacterium]
MTTLGLDELNPSQRAAVEHLSGPLLILAGAGSGKTRVIAYRMAALLQRGVDADRILAVTFTNKAAGELRSRVEGLVTRFGLLPPLDPSDAMAQVLPRGRGLPQWMGTFHSIGARLLRRMADRAELPSDFVILDDDDQLKLCKELCQREKIDETAMPPRALRSQIDRAKNHGLLPEQYRGRDYFTDLVARLYPLYQAELKRLGAVDFGDLLLLPVVLCDRDPELRQILGRRFVHVLVDEFQDVNPVQYQFLRHLSSGHRNLVVVGDDDQAIYGWRGADVRLILEFEHDWPDVHIVKLEENYRSSQVILDAAHAVVSLNSQRRDKRLYTQRAGGERIICHEAIDERREALYVANTVLLLQNEEGYFPDDCAVIYRTNAQSRVLEEALRACGVPYTIVGGARFYDRAEVKDVLAYLRLCHNPADELALRRIINVPARGIGDKTVTKLEARARLGGIPLWLALHNALDDEELLGSGPRKKLRAFLDLIQGLRQIAATLPVSKLAREILVRTGYLALFDGKDAEDQSRQENVLELVGSIEELERESTAQTAGSVELGSAVGPGAETDDAAPNAAALEAALFAPENEGQKPLSLGEYLTRVALVTGEEIGDSGRGVQLMTAHSAKGLEFKVVLVTGLEQGLFPSLRSTIESEEEKERRIAEERRLCYVAMTRARERLFLTHAQTRRIFGMSPRMSPPSQFLREIPADCLERTLEYDAPSRTTPRRPLRPTHAHDDASDSRAHADFDDLDLVQRAALDGEASLTSGALAQAGAGLSAFRPFRSARKTATLDDGEPRVEYDLDDGAGGLRKGQRVRHPQLGRGRIEGITAWQGTVTVQFESGERRTIKAQFLRPDAEYCEP